MTTSTARGGRKAKSTAKARTTAKAKGTARAKGTAKAKGTARAKGTAKARSTALGAGAAKGRGVADVAPFVAPRDAAYERKILADEANAVVTKPRVVLFWGGWPSQWFPSAFTIAGITYNCAEQYMMAEKARTFGDDATLKKILRSKYARGTKELGRAVRGFHKNVWDVLSRHAVYRATLAKFSQNPELKALLLATGERRIGEASPEDDLWGLGIGMKHRDAGTPSKWKGKNWLGEALMHVRSVLRAAKKPPKVEGASDPFLPKLPRAKFRPGF